MELKIKLYWTDHYHKKVQIQAADGTTIELQQVDF